MGKVMVVPSGGGMGACMPPGGYGGYGYGCGIPPFGMIGMWPGMMGGWGGYGDGRGRGGDGGGAYPAALIGGGRVEGNVERQLDMVNDNMNSRFDDTNGDVRTNRVIGAIGGVNDHLGHMSDRAWTTALSDKDMYWQGVVQDLKCCCEQKEVAMDQGCKTRETITCQEEKTRAAIIFEAEKNRAETVRNRELIERLDRERLHEKLAEKEVARLRAETENDNLRQTIHLDKEIRGVRDEFFLLFNTLKEQVNSQNNTVVNNLGTITTAVQTLLNSAASAAPTA